MCRMIDCDHKTRLGASDSHHVGQSWYDHGICACCAIECVKWGMIKANGYRWSIMCHKRNNANLNTVSELGY